MGAGRPRRFDRGAAVDEAVRLFWRKGYNGTSIAELCDAMGIFTPSFYAAFKSKEALYVEVVERYNVLRGPVIWDDLERADSAEAGIRALLRNTAVEYTDAGNPPGCLVILSSESSEGPSRIWDMMVGLREQAYELVHARLHRAAQEGQLPATVDLENLARIFSSLQQGIALQARDGVAREKLLGMVDAMMNAWPMLTQTGSVTG